MQVVESSETPVEQENRSNEAENVEKTKVLEANSVGDDADCGSVLDVSGKTLDFSVPKLSGDSVQGLYIYKNAFNLIPRWLGGLGRLKTLKFFGNEFNLFPPELRNLVELECLQVKISSPNLSGLPLQSMKDLKELELCKVPPRPSVFPLLCEIAGLKSLTKLSVCHFSIRYLPPEIGFLKSLEYLDLSFNKMRNLPTEITFLDSLISLKVTNNKLVDLPLGLSSLQRLETLDLSNNRLTSLGSLELSSMQNLRTLNLQHNKLLICRQLPSWICCNLEGSDADSFIDGFSGAAVEMDVLEGGVQDSDDNVSRKGSPITSSSHLSGSTSTSRCFAARKSGKGWKRRYYIQQRARQERLNSSRKWKSEDPAKLLTHKEADKCKSCNHVALDSDSHTSSLSGLSAPANYNDDFCSAETKCDVISVEDDDFSLKKDDHVDNCSCSIANSAGLCKEGGNDGTECIVSFDAISDAAQVQIDGSSSALSDNSPNSKRHYDKELNNPKPSKRRPHADQPDLAYKYSSTSSCSIDDHLADGFYDAGRDRPFLPLRNYEQALHLDSREVILLDRSKDEELDAIALCAQALVFRFMQINGSTKERADFPIDNLQIASLLALFVSDHFGGRDKTAVIERTRKSVSGSNYRKPFVCTCPTGNSDSIRKSTEQSSESAEDIVFLDLCERSLQTIKARINSIVVPIGTLQFGVCRHRALLMKYLCDRLEPHVPCELVRGYLDFSPHAWNIVVIKKGDSWVRMIVDACHPYDIREETDPEFLCRYIPLNRINVPRVTGSDPKQCAFPSLSACDEIEKAGFSTLVRCDIGSVETVAKVRTLEVAGSSMEDVKNFELRCLGEVRILNAVKNHSCIVEIYGHKISSKWVQSSDGESQHRVLQSAILMEHIKGGSLKNYVKKLCRAGEKHVQGELALYIARDVASALVELHSKHIIYRDIKSENILIDLDSKRPDGTPVVKLCDFDSAIPLRSWLHSCCIAHTGVHPPNICVGTPRWMAPEVFRAMREPDIYGLEVDIWSFGCLLLELLTLQVPYSGLSDSEIHELLHKGKRPLLTEELEELVSSEEPTTAQSGTEPAKPEAELEILKFLADTYCQCMKNNPADRPTAENLYDLLAGRAGSLTNPTSSEQA